MLYSNTTVPYIFLSSTVGGIPYSTVHSKPEAHRNAADEPEREAIVGLPPVVVMVVVAPVILIVVAEPRGVRLNRHGRRNNHGARASAASVVVVVAVVVPTVAVAGQARGGGLKDELVQMSESKVVGVGEHKKAARKKKSKGKKKHCAFSFSLSILSSSRNEISSCKCEFAPLSFCVSPTRFYMGFCMGKIMGFCSVVIVVSSILPWYDVPPVLRYNPPLLREKDAFTN